MELLAFCFAWSKQPTVARRGTTDCLWPNACRDFSWSLPGRSDTSRLFTASLFLAGRNRLGVSRLVSPLLVESSLERSPLLHSDSLPRWIILFRASRSRLGVTASLFLAGRSLVSSALLVFKANLFIAGSLSLPRSSESFWFFTASLFLAGRG